MPVFIDVGKELGDHYEAVVRTRDTILEDFDTSGQEKSAILNATTTIIRELAKLQDDLYQSSLIAKLQDAIVEALEEADPEFKDRVLRILEERLERL
jgi:hypothetical protein